MDRRHTSPELADRVIALRNEGKLLKEVSAETGVPIATCADICRRAAARGEMGFKPVLDGFKITKTTERTDKHGDFGGRSVTQTAAPGEKFEVPEGLAITGVSALLDQDDNVTRKWVLTRKAHSGDIDPAAYAERMEAAFADFKPYAWPQPAIPHEYVDQLQVYPWADPHFGMFAWKGDTGQNWDLKIARRAVHDVFSKVIARSPYTRRALLIIGGDILHADNGKNTTTAGTFQDVDGRFSKVVDMAGETAVDNINLLLQHHEEVEVIVLPGNHDETSFYAITMFLRAWFRNEPRVTIDRSPNPLRYREFGKVMLGMTHGHKAKASRMPLLMAADNREMWGRTKFPYAHTFHVHHASKDQDEDGGVWIETHRIIAPQDAWHYAEGYRSGRGLVSITYDPERGEVGRATETL